MTDKKHFKYEGNVSLELPKLSVDDVEFTDFQFLVPCKIGMKIDGKEQKKVVHVNLADRRVFDSDGKEWDTDVAAKFFYFMDEVNALPEDFYVADDETIEQAAAAKSEFDGVRNHQCGG